VTEVTLRRARPAEASVLTDLAAAVAGFEYLEIAAEPNAEGFYRKMGAQSIGETPSASIPGRMLPLLRVRIPAGTSRGGSP
jgi:hypothetical protein